jgi:hypothetical protein
MFSSKSTQPNPESLTKFTDPDPRGPKTYGSADPDLAPEDDNLNSVSLPCVLTKLLI